MNKLVRSILPLCLCILTGCEGDGMDMVNTFIPQRVRISHEQPPDGQVGKAYSYVMTAEVENDPNDSDYDYRFDLVDGSLPPGTQFAELLEKGNMHAKIAGVPTQTGQFFFAVSVETDIESYWWGDRESDEAVYSITVR